MSKTPENLYSHLSELRKCLIFSFFVLCGGFAVCWFFSENILNLISLPIAPYLKHSEGHLIFTAPMDEFLAHIKICIFGAFVLGFPFIIYQVWKFLAPGLYKHEKKIIVSLSLLSALLFFSGILFIYFIVYPLAFKFLLSFGSSTALISIKEYLSFFIQTCLAFGLLFETPLIIFGLVYLKILQVNQLKKWRRYAVVLLAVVSAVATPPDILSMILLLIPLYLLYELSIWTSALLIKQS